MEEELVHIYLKPDMDKIKKKIHKIYEDEMYEKKKKKIKILDENYLNQKFSLSRTV